MNGKINDSAEFENEIKTMGDRQLAEWSARELYKMNTICTTVQQHNVLLHGDPEKEGDLGLAGRIDRTERKQKDNRSLIVAMWAVLAGLVASVMTLFFRHVDQSQDVAKSIYTFFKGEQ